VDLHVHTCHSVDSLSTLPEIVRWTLRRGLGALAITDHDTIRGALELAAMAPFCVIVGEEISTSGGDLIGLFLRREIEPGLSPLATAEAIHDQGGLVYVPHPLDRARRQSALGYEGLMAILDRVDLVESWNARVAFRADNQAAAALAASHHLLAGAGSDAHQPSEIGRGWVAVAPFVDAAGFLAGLRGATVFGRTSTPLVHLGSTYARLAKELAMRR